MKALLVAAVGAAVLVGALAPAEARDGRRHRDRGETTVIRRGVAAPNINLGLLLALGAFGQQKQFREPVQQQEFYDEPKLRNPIPLK